MVELDKECQKKAAKLRLIGRRIFRTKNMLPGVLVFIWILIYNLTRFFLAPSFYNNQDYAQSFFYRYIEFAYIYYLAALLVSYYSLYKYQRHIKLTTISFVSWCRFRIKASFIGLGSFKRFANLYPLDEHKYAELTSRLREQAKKDGISNVDLLVYPGSKFSKTLNAAIIGSSKNCSIVLWDGLLSGNISGAEIVSTVAHEQGHFIHKHNDQLSSLVKIILVVTATILAFVFGGISLSNLSRQNILLMAFPSSLFIAYSFLQMGLLLVRVISRQMEYIADAHAVIITSDRRNILNSFIKEVNLSFVEFNPSPFNEFIYDDHPSTKKRLSMIAGSKIKNTW
jgi:Zn-dependent protease with chaperone function